ncbi:Leucine Rich Repeat family protein [Aphelenchoides avenae]|nr:Leucine Rich Repeat family protein [Aphelenchus avenae]
MHAVGSPRSESERSPFRITTPPELSVVGPDGTLNLANRKLCKLSDKGKDTFATVKRLVISNNSFKQLDALVWFKECEEVNASHNDFMRLRCFAAIGKTLTVLDVSSNRLASLDCLSSLKQLRSLNVSHNRIEYVPTLHLPHLEEINVGSNHVKELPDLHKLTALRTLNLHGNEISSLEHVEKKLPRGLRYLDIGDNLIEDLCELHDLASFVELESISIINNPCVRGEGRKFSYRPFVYSCILNELSAVDDSDLSDQEMIKGEWLHTAGKTRGFRPGTGSHDDLCEYLARECPRELGEHQLENSFTEKLRKVVEKRREYMSSSHDESSLSLSLHTPISPAMRTARTPQSSEGRRTAVKRTAVKPRSIFESSGSDVEADRSMASDITSTTVVISKADFRSSQEAATAGTVDRCAGVSPSSSTTTIVAEFDEDTHSQGPTDSEGQRRPHSDPVLSQRAHILSATPYRPHSEEPPTVRLTVAQRLMANMQRLTDQRQVEPIVPDAQPPTTAEGTVHDRTLAQTSENDHEDSEEPTPRDDRKTREAATKVQAWWRGVLERRKHASRMVDLLRLQVSSLEAKVDDLTTQTSLLTKINEELTKTILEWASLEESSLMARLEKKQAGIESTLDNRIEELERAVSALLRDQYNMVPTPTKLTYVRRSDSQAIISWENALPLSSAIQGYELFINGESCGQISAPGRKAIVDMINPDEDLLVTIQAISSLGNGLRSAAAEVVIPKMSSDDKENVDALHAASK